MSDSIVIRVQPAIFEFVRSWGEKKGLNIGEACDDLVRRAQHRLESIDKGEAKKKADRKVKREATGA